MRTETNQEAGKLASGRRIFPLVGRRNAPPPRRAEPSVLALLGIAVGAWMGLIATATLLFG